MPRIPIVPCISVLICCAAMVVPGISGAQYAPPDGYNPTAPAPVAQYAPSPDSTNSVAPAPVETGPETIEVQAPRLFRFETQPTNGTLQKASLEGRVSYADLNLLTDDGVFVLRSRIANEAADICAQLAQLYPVYAAVGTSCVKDAIEDGNIRANRVINEVREPTY